MNIKNIKAIQEILPNWYKERYAGGMTIVEDIVDDPNTLQDEAGRCMPYKAYRIPQEDDLCVMIMEFMSMEHAIEIKVNKTDTGAFYSISALVYGPQDYRKIETFSPFLDDALAEALIEAKKATDDKREMVEEMEKLDKERTKAGHSLE